MWSFTETGIELQALSISMKVTWKVILADENRNLLSLRMRNKIDILDGTT